MFTSIDKALVALVMAIVVLLDWLFGYKLGLNEEGVTLFVAFITPVLVWLVPNKQEE